MEGDWKDAVFRIDGAANEKTVFGTGFACYREGAKTYLITCFHVIDEIGESNARIREQSIKVVASGDDTLDLALIEVEGLPDCQVLPLNSEGKSGSHFTVYGHTWADPNDKRSGKSIARPLEGQLGADTAFSSKRWPKVPAWDLPFK